MPIFLKLILHKTKIQYIITIDFVDSTQSKTLRKRSALFVFIYSYMAFTHRRTIWQIFNSEPEDKKARRDCRGCISPATPRTLKSFFETIVKEILDRQDCAVFYPEPGTQPEDVEDYELRLKEMQLFVVPVTTKLLTQKNRAMDVDVPFAFENRIPVLPLMQESGLDDIFNKKFGDLQYLDKNNSDPTAIPYEEKLTKYLDAIIVGDKLAKKVRAAFDAYIFLSYRKKDRRYAQELMRLIHQNDFCRDIAIWYDEFLTPGEDFNDAIKAALEKSGLFALAVTPNLINEINYILNIEYPMAQEMGKNILPAEMEPTDREKLREMYPDIPDVVVRSDKQTLCDRLMTSLKGLAIAENDNDPQHNFFIGLAYLGGIDVEVNHERAVNLITGSAEQGYIPAIEKLVSMYNSGEGVSRDYHKAVEWQKSLVEERKKKYESNPGETTALILLSDLWDLGDAYQALGQLSSAQNTYEEMRCFSEQFSQKYTDKRFTRYQSVSYNKLGDIAKAQGKLSDAEEWYRKGLAIAEELEKETGTVEEARRDLSISYNNLGNLAKAQGKLSDAEEWCRKGLALREALAEETGTVQARRDLSVSYNNLGDIAQAQGRLRKAEEWYRKGLVIFEALAEETGTVEARNDLSSNYKRLVAIAQAQGKLSDAEEWYRKSLAIDEALAEETGTVQARRDLSVSYNKLGITAEVQGKLSDAEKWYRKCLAINAALAEEVQTFKSYDDLAVSCYRIGKLTANQAMLEQALGIWEKLAEFFPENPKYRRFADIVKKVLQALFPDSD